jgi:uncharacterized protein DUF4231
MSLSKGDVLKYAESETGGDGDTFGQALKAARDIKDKYVNPRIRWYETHTSLPRTIYRFVGIATIILSVTLPALASAQFEYKEIVVSAISVVIAALTGLGSFYHWERTWRGNSKAQVAIEQAVGKWELELRRAEFVVAQNDRVNHVIKATDDLLTNTGAVVSSESEGFFSNLPAARQNSAGKV